MEKKSSENGKNYREDLLKMDEKREKNEEELQFEEVLKLMRLHDRKGYEDTDVSFGV